jgi:hypothetical protein
MKFSCQRFNGVIKKGSCVFRTAIAEDSMARYARIAKRFLFELSQRVPG